MKTTRWFLAMLAGAVTLSLSGYVIYAVLFPRFYADFMSAGSAAGVEREQLLVWAVALGMLAYSALITLAIGANASPRSVTSGAVTGALVSWLLWSTADLMLYGISNVGSLSGIVIDPLLKAAAGAIAGAVIAGVLVMPAEVTITDLRPRHS